MATSRRPTVRDVAGEAGVSVATVSNVLNRPGGTGFRVRPETRARVLAAAQRLGYQANRSARGLRRGRTEQVCVVSEWPRSPWAVTLADDVARVAARYGYRALMLLGGDWPVHLREGGADGAVIDASGATDVDVAALRALADAGSALVVHTNHAEPDGFDVVRTNERSACDAAMDLLVARGHRRIACLRPAPGQPPAHRSERFESYRAALERNGIAFDQSLVGYVADSRELAHTRTIELLRSANPPTAIFATSDLSAIGALWAAHRLGVRVPDDLAIIGVGNVPEGAVTDPPLTTVGPPELDFTDVGELLFDRILRRSAGADRIHLQRWALLRRGTA